MPPRSTDTPTDRRLAQLEEGLTVSQLAERFNLSPRSVNERLARLMKAKQPRANGFSTTGPNAVAVLDSVEWGAP